MKGDLNKMQKCKSCREIVKMEHVSPFLPHHFCHGSVLSPLPEWPGRFLACPLPPVPKLISYPRGVLPELLVQVKGGTGCRKTPYGEWRQIMRSLPATTYLLCDLREYVLTSLIFNFICEEGFLRLSS